MSKDHNQRNLDRVEQVLNYVHSHLDNDLSVERLSKLSGWSRWQLQRVFAAKTGLGMAQYVRELRLSHAAELLVTSGARQIDIAFSCGFDSENSFSRSFKQVFACSPSFYRNRGKRIGLRTPINRSMLSSPQALNYKLHQVRIESHSEIEVHGVAGTVNGLFSSRPDFLESVPKLWSKLKQNLTDPLLKPTKNSPFIGVIDTRSSAEHDTYWASIDPCHLSTPRALGRLLVPAQEYAVIPFHGPLRDFNKVLNWFLFNWLPESNYEGVYGYDLEIYHADSKDKNTMHMEYWVPIESLLAP